jgi:hypothetical protein
MEAPSEEEAPVGMGAPSLSLLPTDSPEMPPVVVPADHPLVELVGRKEQQLSSEKEEELEAFLQGAVKTLMPAVQRAPWFLQGKREPLEASTGAASGGQEEFDRVQLSMASSRHGYRFHAAVDDTTCRLSERCHDTAAAANAVTTATIAATTTTAAAIPSPEASEALEGAEDGERWLCMWCSVMNLGGELCANRRCLRDRSLAGIEQGATRKRAAPQRLDASAKHWARASRAPEKVPAGGEPKAESTYWRDGKKPMQPVSSSARPKKSPPPGARSYPPPYPPAVPKAVAALRHESEPLIAEPLSPRAAERLIERRLPFADVLKVEPRRSSPLRRSSNEGSSPTGSPRALACSPCSPGSPLNLPGHVPSPMPSPMPLLAREVSVHALAPKLAFKNHRKSDPRVPPGGTISPMGYILDADGRLVRDADGRPMQVGSSPPSPAECSEGSGYGSYDEKRHATSTPSPSSPLAKHAVEIVDAVENGFEHIVLTTTVRTLCPECGDRLLSTSNGERFCNNVDCDNEDLFVLDD